MKNMFAQIQQLQNNRFIKSLGPIGILLVILLFLFIFTPTFRSSANLTQILLSAAVYMMMAMGMTFVIIIGGIDLSLGSVVGLAGGITCMALVTFHLPLGVGILAGVLVGVLCGAINGFMVTKMGLIPFIATLGGQWIYRGALRLLNNGATITIRGLVPDETLNALSYLGNGRFLRLPIPVYVVIVSAVILTFLLKKTVFGRSVYAIGSNTETARMSGININKVTFSTFVLAGGLSGIAGVILTARMVSAQANFGTGYEFEGIFASVVGGVSMAGGEGNVLGALVGALIVAVLRNGLNLNGVNSFWQQVILGILIVLVVYADTLRSRKERAL
jgi:ribose transport system permease protein